MGLDPANDTSVPDVGDPRPLYDKFLDVWKKAKDEPGGIPILGRRVTQDVAEALVNISVSAVSAEFDICQLPHIILDHKLTLKAHLAMLSEIRDNTELPARDRMAAGDKIQQILLTFLRAHTSPASRPAYANQASTDDKKNILGVLVNVNTPIGANPVGQTIEAKVQALPKVEEIVSVLNDRDET